MALRDWNPFARRDEAEADSDRTPSHGLASALADLDRLAADRPELAPACRPLARVLRAAFLAPVPTPALHADPELLAAAWRAGVPAFRAGDQPPPLDRDDLRARAGAVCEAILDENPGAGRLLDALRGLPDLLHSRALDVLAGRDDALDDQAGPPGVEPALARSVLRLALLPPLSALSEALAAVRPEGAWSRGECPNCGNPPSLAESRGLGQRRYWRCGVCAAGWEGERLRCPFCGLSDHTKLHYRFVEGEQDRCRLALCDGCGGRLMVISTLAPVSAPGLLVAELATAHLDLS